MNKTVKCILKVLLVLVLILALAVGGYVAYMQSQYYRIEDKTPLEIYDPSLATLEPGKEYSAMSYNVGFGAYGPEYSFFMDAGVMDDGTAVTGEHGKALSEQSVLDHTAGALSVMQKYQPDFVLLQEVDEDSDRSYHVNQHQAFVEGMPDYSSIFALNFHSAYLMYPFNDPHGAVQGGLLTLSKYAVNDAVRRSYPVDGSFITKFTDLDRCFAEIRVPVQNGKELVLLHSHMSAYDKGGTIRQQQLEMITGVMAEEYAKGNYVIVGGDFNHALGHDVAEAFPCRQQFPAWVFILDDEDLPEHFSIARADNRTEVATCRAAEIPYEKGVNFETVVDGFWVSDNIEYTAENIDTGYANSDHNPVLMHFTLKD